MRMKLKLANLLQSKTKYQIVGKSIEGHFLYSESVGFLFQEGIQQLQKPASASNLVENIVAVPDIGIVSYASLTLASAPGSAEECRQHILDMLDELGVY